jgi:DNA-binding response OmpR family regulator
LRDAIILVVEDEAVIALDLTYAIEDAGGIVIGLAASSIEALNLIDAAESAHVVISGAVLDCMLADRDSAPVVRRLHACGVPMVVYSAVGLPIETRAWSAEIPWIAKPGSTKHVVAMLSAKIDAALSRVGTLK